MKPNLLLVILPLITAFLAFKVRAQLNIEGADGSDGQFHPTTSTNIDLSAAVSADWNSDNTADQGKGVYDASRWAVVFKYSSINIPAGVVVTFKNHPSRAPVVWLVSGDVVIEGNVSLNGENRGALTPSESGPGGFRGGVGNRGALTLSGAGFGPGGGGIAFRGGPGLYQTGGTTIGESQGFLYGNSQILPLIGGSGAGGFRGNGYGGSAPSGGAGGGAILIASSGRIIIQGVITADSEYGPDTGSNYRMAGGSGGAVRLLAERIEGSGSISARSLNDFNDIGGYGRIRIETKDYAAKLKLLPYTVSTLPDAPPLIWPRAGSAETRILSVAGRKVPIDPRASLEANGADVSLQDDQPVDIVVETKNMDIDTTVVNIRITPLHGSAQMVIAKFTSGTKSQATWIATTKLPINFATIQARAVSP